MSTKLVPTCTLHAGDLISVFDETHIIATIGDNFSDTKFDKLIMCTDGFAMGVESTGTVRVPVQESIFKITESEPEMSNKPVNLPEIGVKADEFEQLRTNSKVAYRVRVFAYLVVVFVLGCVSASIAIGTTSGASAKLSTTTTTNRNPDCFWSTHIPARAFRHHKFDYVHGTWYVDGSVVAYAPTEDSPVDICAGDGS